MSRTVLGLVPNLLATGTLRPLSAISLRVASSCVGCFMAAMSNSLIFSRYILTASAPFKLPVMAFAFPLSMPQSSGGGISCLITFSVV